MNEYIERQAALAYKPLPRENRHYKTPDLYEAWDAGYDYALHQIRNIPVANVVDLDEGLLMGAQLAAMHGSDATSWQLEQAFFDGVEEGIKKRNVRPVVYGRNVSDFPSLFECSVCGWCCNDTLPGDSEYNFCPNCGADVRRTE